MIEFVPAALDTPDVTTGKLEPQWVRQAYAQRLQELIEDAAHDGVVLTIELEPVAPLAMGNYVMRGHVRGAAR